MTIVCAVKCKEGIVLGSDSQATMATTGASIRHSMQKIYKIGEKTIFTGCGTIGLLNKARETIQRYSEDLDNGLRQETLDKIKKELYSILKEARDRYVDYERKTEGTPTIDIAICGVDPEGKFKIWHMGQDTHDEFMDTVGMWVGGSANTAGYILLKSYANTPYGYQEEEPKIKECTLMVYRAIREVIATLATNVGGAIHIWYMDNSQIYEFSYDDMNNINKRYMNWKKEEAELLRV